MLVVYFFTVDVCGGKDTQLMNHAVRGFNIHIANLCDLPRLFSV